MKSLEQGQPWQESPFLSLLFTFRNLILEKWRFHFFLSSFCRFFLSASCCHLAELFLCSSFLILATRTNHAATRSNMVLIVHRQRTTSNKSGKRPRTFLLIQHRGCALLLQRQHGHLKQGYLGFYGELQPCNYRTKWDLATKREFPMVPGAPPGPSTAARSQKFSPMGLVSLLDWNNRVIQPTKFHQQPRKRDVIILQFIQYEYLTYRFWTFPTYNWQCNYLVNIHPISPCYIMI